MEPKYKLTYFAAKGIGEPIRYLLSYRGIEFEDIRLDLEAWASVKKSTPYGRIPVLEIDGKELTQSKSICRYLAKEAGLCGKDDWENLQIDIIADVVHDLRLEVFNYYWDPNEQSKAEKKNLLFSEILPRYLKKLDTIVDENKGYLANKRLSWADFYFMGYIEHVSSVFKQDVLQRYPHLKELTKTVQEIPKIKKYIEKRPADMPL